LADDTLGTARKACNSAAFHVPGPTSLSIAFRLSKKLGIATKEEFDATTKKRYEAKDLCDAVWEKHNIAKRKSIEDMEGIAKARASSFRQHPGMVDTFSNSIRSDKVLSEAAKPVDQIIERVEEFLDLVTNGNALMCLTSLHHAYNSGLAGS